jgi:pimeloyl-ACP methyl ester carboxylesterase
MSTTTLLGITAAAAMALSVAAGPVKAAPTQPVKNIVLVHGAFADGSSWTKVIAILQAKGYNVTAVQNPLTSLADDVAATNRALALQKGPVILVGHSWAGAVITEAGLDPKVAGLVYVAAFAPDADEIIGNLGKNYPPAASFAAPIIDAQGFMSLSTEAIVKHFAWDLPPARRRCSPRRRRRSRLRPSARRCPTLRGRRNRRGTSSPAKTRQSRPMKNASSRSGWAQRRRNWPPATCRCFRSRRMCRRSSWKRRRRHPTKHLRASVPRTG